MKPEQLGPETYIPKTSSDVTLEFVWKAVRVNVLNVGPDFPFHLELVEDRYRVRFLEFRSSSDPPADIGNPGDIWLNVSPASYVLFALNANKEWVRWCPTLDTAGMIVHPFLPLYALWCTIKQASWYHRDKIGGDWAGRRLTARQDLGGYACAADMLDPSVGVRLILLHEEMQRNKSKS
ncbi:hypothetical protein DFH07DRAFT_952027 [Mycena maculata]|uniref:Uncharacterized protein n=1 Tax=Mycena maculata TaxID=230809 RepID=A0AAD7K0C9_9AGAR|nr:hypothetical protein DFH07DRAFT_952027 [Mycena maculata]